MRHNKTIASIAVLIVVCNGCARTTASDEPPQAGQTFPGKVEAARKAELAFQVSGLILSMPVKEGQRVARGEVIAQLRTADFEARLNALEGQLDLARAQLKALREGERPEEKRRLQIQVRAQETKLRNSQLDLDRVTQLIDRCHLIDGTMLSAVSKSEADLSKTKYELDHYELQAAIEAVNRAETARAEDIEAKEAEIRMIGARLAEAQIQLDDTALRAPYDGVIVRRLVEEKQNVWANYPVLKFQDTATVLIACKVPECVMARGPCASELQRVMVEFAAVPGREFEAEFCEASQEADPATATYTVRLAMKGPTDGDVLLLPGMTCTVRPALRHGNGSTTSKLTRATPSLTAPPSKPDEN